MLDSTYAGRELGCVCPTDQFPSDEMKALIRPSGRWPTSCSSTAMPARTSRLSARRGRSPRSSGSWTSRIDKNMIDKDEYPQTAEIERRCVHMLADLWNAPHRRHADRVLGDRLVRGLHARWHGRQVALAAKRRERPGKPTDKPNMVCGPVQVVWHKFARYWDVEMREIPMAPGRYGMDAEQMLERVDENTIMVVPTFGVTYTGSYEPVLELSKALDDLQERTGLDIDIHVDGASGAFLAPFCAPDVVWDFRVPRVKSISTSGHKFGLAPLGVGLGSLAGRLRAPRRADLPRDLPGRRHAGLPAQLLAPGRPDRRPVLQLRPPRQAGLPARPHACYDTGRYLAEAVIDLGPFELSVSTATPRRASPRSPGASVRVRTPATPSTTWRTGCASRGWQVPAYPLTGSLSRRRGPADPRAPGSEPRPRERPAADIRDAIAHFRSIR